MSRIKNKSIEVSSSFDINNQKLINVATPLNNLDGANKLYVDSNISGYTTNFVNVSGDTMTGTLYGTAVSATTISASTLYANGIQITGDTYVTGGTYNNGTLTLNQQNSNISITGFSTSTAVAFTGGTVTGATTFTNGITANTISGNIVETITAGEALNAGNLVYLSTDGKYYNTSNSNSSTCKTELRVTITTMSANTSNIGLVQGIYTTTGLTAGSKYWVGVSGGTYSNMQPTADNSIVRYIGTAISTTQLEFNPDSTYIEIYSFPNSTPYTGVTGGVGLSQDDIIRLIWHNE